MLLLCKYTYLSSNFDPKSISTFVIVDALYLWDRIPQFQYKSIFYFPEFWLRYFVSTRILALIPILKIFHSYNCRYAYLSENEYSNFNKKVFSTSLSCDYAVTFHAYHSYNLKRNRLNQHSKDRVNCEYCSIDFS